MKAFFFQLVHCGCTESVPSYMSVQEFLVQSGCLNKDVDNASSFRGDDCLQPVTFSLKTTSWLSTGFLRAMKYRFLRS